MFWKIEPAFTAVLEHDTDLTTHQVHVQGSDVFHIEEDAAGLCIIKTQQ